MSEISHFRFIFNPYDWSTVINWTVNISLISALLISLSLWELSTKRFSWFHWHWSMKRNVVVATNIRIQDLLNKRNNNRRRFPVIKILKTVVLGLLPAGNI